MHPVDGHDIKGADYRSKLRKRITWITQGFFSRLGFIIQLCEKLDDNEADPITALSIAVGTARGLPFPNLPPT